MQRFLAGWVMVSTESGRLLDHPDELAVDLAEVRHDGNGVYTITTSTNEQLRLIKRVGPLRPGVTLEYSVSPADNAVGPDDLPAAGPAYDRVPTVELTLSERLADDEIGPALARVLAESTAARAPDGDRVFSPGGTPDLDVVQRPADAGLRAELRQRGRLPGQAARIRALALTMGVADGQPNAELLRTLLTEEERQILDRAANGERPLEDRVDRAGYLAKALGGSGVSSVVIGTAAAAFTGNPLVGIGIAVPTIVNATVGSAAERQLDGQKASGRKPAYNAERKQREYDHPGLLGLLDGAERTRPQAVKMPRATAWRNYLVRYIKPTLATAAVAGALTPFGVPALSSAMVIASSALAKSLAERLVDTKKLEFRLRRIDATERLRLSDPELYVNQLATEFSELRARLDRVVASLDPGARPAVPAVPADVPGSPPYQVGLAAQLIENVSGSARRALLGGKSASADPTALQSLLSAAGPGVLGAVTGAMGDKYFLNRDEVARDASKQWSRRHQEAAQAAALDGILGPRLRGFRDLVDRLEELTGVPPDLSTRAADRGLPVVTSPPDQSARAADRGLPVVTSPPAVPRPPARARWSAYAVQAAAGSLGGVAAAVGLDQVFDIPDLSIVLTAAGAAGSMTATPVARYTFRSRELRVHEGLETNKAVRAVNQSELIEQRAIIRYLMTQLSMRADAIIRDASPRPVVELPSSAYTDHVRAAVRRAELDNVPTRQPETSADTDARFVRVQALEQVDHCAAEIDRLTALDGPSTSSPATAPDGSRTSSPTTAPDGSRTSSPATALDGSSTSSPATAPHGSRTSSLTTARDKVRFAIERYESIADSNGLRRAFPDLGAVDPADGRPVVGGTTDQVRAGVDQAVRRLVAEPSGKPLLAERLITLEQLSRAADAVDHHAIHGTDESRAYVQNQFDQTLAEAARLWQEAGVPNGLVLPAVGVAPSAEPAVNEDEKLRQMVDRLLGSAPRPEGGPGVRRTEGCSTARRTEGGPAARRTEDGSRGR
ncbi:hypothetical protein [Kribbella kalugense]|uniref:Uncharacterized protein n=1 Tax=Kribbella kalugense TaxID=2512221 RepID=A0A4R7ZII6_9ACTN|nr:hypothetical protein [Kribbella kalugense]TDW17212.1 hypothetical protein EV650_3776 [Kribbella kalugense]